MVMMRPPAAPSRSRAGRSRSGADLRARPFAQAGDADAAFGGRKHTDPRGDSEGEVEAGEGEARETHAGETENPAPKVCASSVEISFPADGKLTHMFPRALATFLVALPIAAAASSTSGECPPNNHSPLAAAAAITTAAATIATTEQGVADALRTVVKSGKVPQDMLITYDDMDSLHGGDRLEVLGDGRARRTELKHGGMKPVISLRTVSDTELLALAKELVGIEAWKQKTPEREAIPDESKSLLTISIAGKSVTIWEWYNDMDKTYRIQKVFDRLDRLAASDVKKDTEDPE
jgi:hypothetical protein